MLICGISVVMGVISANPCFAKESKSFSISITIPKIIEQVNKPLDPPLLRKEEPKEKDTGEKYEKNETEAEKNDSKKLDYPEGYTMIVRTIIQET